MNRNKTTSIDRDGNLYVLGTSNFTGTLLELKNLINKTIDEHGEKTKCEFSTYSTKGYRGCQIIIKKQ